MTIFCMLFFYFFNFDAVTRCFYENYMNLGKNTANGTFIFKHFVMKNSKEQTILVVTIDIKLNCRNHIKKLYRLASQKVGALSRLSNSLNGSEKNLVFNSLVKSQFLLSCLDVLLQNIKQHDRKST